MALAGALLSTGGALLGRHLSREDRERQRRLEREALGIYDDMAAPTLDRVTAERVSTAPWESLPSDFGNRSARNAALQRIISMGMEGGMDAGSRLAQAQAEQDAALFEQQQRQAIAQNMRARGMGGVGEALLSLQAQQAGANRAHMGGLQSAADARSRALAALAQGGSLAGQAEAQDAEAAMRRAEALSRIGQFNANVGLQAGMFNAGQGQREWENRMGLADRRVGARQAAAGQAGRDAANTAQMWGGIGQGLGYAADQAGQAALSAMGGGMGGFAKPGMAPAAPATTRPLDKQKRRQP